jgi:hypothetical protein
MAKTNCPYKLIRKGRYDGLLGYEGYVWKFGSGSDSVKISTNLNNDDWDVERNNIQEFVGNKTNLLKKYPCFRKRLKIEFSKGVK